MNTQGGDRTQLNNDRPETAVDLGKHVIEVGAETVKDALDATVASEVGGAKVVEAAAVKTAQTTVEVSKKAKSFWNGLGPGLVTGASDDDPSGIGTYSQTGAQFGFQLLWLSWLTLPMMSVVQEMCARIGLVTGRGLASNIKRHFPRSMLITTAFLLFLANSFNIGANLSVMAKSTQLLVPWLPFWYLLIGFVLLSLILQIFVPYQKYANYLKYLALVLLVYIATAFVIKDFDWLSVLKSFLHPTIIFQKEQIILICAILGTTISPYLFFWQTSQEVEDQIEHGQTTIASRQSTDLKSVKKMRMDVWSGMVLANIVMFFIIAVCASVFYKNGIFTINSASEAAMALRPLAGEYAYLLFAIGIIGTGLLAIPVLAGSASYAISETFGWKEGLYLRFKQAVAFYSMIIIAMLIGLLTNLLGIPPFKALIYAAIFNGIVSPIVLVPIVYLSSNQKIMGEWVNKPWVTVFGWIITGLMVLAGLATLYSFFF